MTVPVYLLGASPPSTNTYQYTYDANGNTETETLGTTTDSYIYDPENRLVHATTQFTQNTETCTTGDVDYSYDADGIRRSTTKAGVTTRYLTDKNRDYAQVLEERDGADTLIVQYTYGDDLVSQKRGAAVSYYMYDGQLSTRQLTSSTGAVTDRYVYDAFGVRNPDLSDDTTPNHYRYTGEQYDCNVGFYYLRARYYNQGVGRFTTRDPLDAVAFEPKTLHKYTYVSNDPVDKQDPSGMLEVGIGSVLAAVAITTLIGAIVSTAITYSINRALGKPTNILTVFLSGLISTGVSVSLCAMGVPPLLAFSVGSGLASLYTEWRNDTLPTLTGKGRVILAFLFGGLLGRVFGRDTRVALGDLAAVYREAVESVGEAPVRTLLNETLKKIATNLWPAFRTGLVTNAWKAPFALWEACEAAAHALRKKSPDYDKIIKGLRAESGKD